MGGKGREGNTPRAPGKGPKPAERPGERYSSGPEWGDSLSASLSHLRGPSLNFSKQALDSGLWALNLGPGHPRRSGTAGRLEFGETVRPKEGTKAQCGQAPLESGYPGWGWGWGVTAGGGKSVGD